MASAWSEEVPAGQIFSASSTTPLPPTHAKLKRHRNEGESGHHPLYSTSREKFDHNSQAAENKLRHETPFARSLKNQLAFPNSNPTLQKKKGKKTSRFWVSLKEEQGLGSPSLPGSQALHRAATWCRRTFQCCCTKYFWKLPLLIIYRDVPQITPTSLQPLGLGKPFHPRARTLLHYHASSLSSTVTRTSEWPCKQSPPAAASPPPSPRGRSGSIQSQGPLWACRRLPGSLPAAAAAPHAGLLPPSRAAARPPAPKTQSTYPEIEPTASSFLVGGLGRGKVGKGERGGSQGGFQFSHLKKGNFKKGDEGKKKKKAQQYLVFRDTSPRHTHKHTRPPPTKKKTTTGN